MTQLIAMQADIPGLCPPLSMKESAPGMCNCGSVML